MLIGFLIACGVMLAVLIGAAVYLFRYVIVSKRNTGKQIESDDFETSEEIRIYYEEYTAWFESVGFEIMDMTTWDNIRLRVIIFRRKPNEKTCGLGSRL
jgi:hypothetical protein